MRKIYRQTDGQVGGRRTTGYQKAYLNLRFRSAKKETNKLQCCLDRLKRVLTKRLYWKINLHSWQNYGIGIFKNLRIPFKVHMYLEKPSPLKNCNIYTAVKMTSCIRTKYSSLEIGKIGKIRLLVFKCFTDWQTIRYSTCAIWTVRKSI